MPLQPMFPLGAVLFPTMVMPLHVFEPRYRQLMADCLAGDQTFGVTLIERGSEVGGGDIRSSVGTLARIIEAQELDDGRWVLAAVGVERIRINEWLPDNPYPRAHVEPWPDADIGSTTELIPIYQQRCGELRRILALACEMGVTGAPSTLELSDDPAAGSHQLATAAPVGPFDRQRLLACPGIATRLDLLGELLAETDEILQRRLAAAAESDDDSSDRPDEA